VYAAAGLAAAHAQPSLHRQRSGRVQDDDDGQAADDDDGDDDGGDGGDAD